MRLLLAAVLGLTCASAAAAARIAGVTATQSAPLEAQITVTIERPTPLDMLCDATVDPGDGTPRALKFGVGDRHIKTLQHKYDKAGTYKVSVKGSGKCQGAREASVAVHAGPAAKEGAAACPRGWALATGSLKGNRYTCHAQAPAKPIKCEGDTRYFAENGVIGCR